ncbi:hypothetical protein ACFVYP_02375 [Kitasatospora sp. NPDC058201]|uniref:hypothetical protein n=1 Tax=unclassified Kitasatospora TaxID=2633591 RepID=UPI00365A8C18
MTAPSTTNTDIRDAGTPGAVRTSLVSGVIGGVIGAVMSAAANYLIVGTPDDETANAVNHAVSGLISGFMAGFVGLLIHQRKAASAARAR